MGSENYRNKYKKFNNCEWLEEYHKVLTELFPIKQATEEQNYIIKCLISDLEDEIFHCEPF